MRFRFSYDITVLLYFQEKMWKNRKKTTSFDLLNRLRSRAATTRGAHKELQTPAPCESTLAVEYGGYNLLLVSPP